MRGRGREKGIFQGEWCFFSPIVDGRFLLVSLVIVV